ncbi:hypothetical protein LCGC14_0932250 [marine sediment metagenome]|uniref:Uncharacterized protein n=1 Tax=marine sediment metagenome TaxID=412755 RepID=A0A0F9NS90_9ZZZZ
MPSWGQLMDIRSVVGFMADVLERVSIDDQYAHTIRRARKFVVGRGKPAVFIKRCTVASWNGISMDDAAAVIAASFGDLRAFKLPSRQRRARFTPDSDFISCGAIVKRTHRFAEKAGLDASGLCIRWIVIERFGEFARGWAYSDEMVRAAAAAMAAGAEDVAKDLLQEVDDDGGEEIDSGDAAEACV